MVGNDRMRMMEQAVNLVNTFRYTTHFPGQDPGDVPNGGPGLTPQEESTYNAALSFLTREFISGPKDIVSGMFFPSEAMDEEPGEEEREHTTEPP